MVTHDEEYIARQISNEYHPIFESFQIICQEELGRCLKCPESCHNLCNHYRIFEMFFRSFGFLSNSSEYRHNFRNQRTITNLRTFSGLKKSLDSGALTVKMAGVCSASVKNDRSVEQFLPVPPPYLLSKR